MKEEKRIPFEQRSGQNPDTQPKTQAAGDDGSRHNWQNAKYVPTVVIAVLALIIVVALNRPARTKDAYEEASEEIVTDRLTKAYRDVLEKVISEHKRFVISDDGVGIVGLKYGNLVDFENDGIPEMVLLYGQTVEVYRFDGKNAALFKRFEIGLHWLQSDVSPEFLINCTAETPYLINWHCSHSWVAKEYTVWTIRNGQGVSDEYFAGPAEDVALDDNDFPVKEFSVFRINGASVTAEEFRDKEAEFFDRATTIHALFSINPVAAKAELDNFLFQFGL